MTADRHAILNSRALSTLLHKEDRISRIQDGYGDFCFARDRCIDCFDPLDRSTHRNSEPEGNGTASLSSSEVSASELQVSFFRLPKDIRDIIYEYWVAPFRNPWQEDRIKIEIGVVHDKRCHPFRNGYTVGVPLSVKKTDSIFHNNLPHRHLSRIDYDRLRSLSQVSHQLRAELGAVFWSNVYVDIDHWEYLFVDFLKDRPAVCGGIKKLRMEWGCEDRATDLNDGWAPILGFCAFVKDKLHLEELEFVLSTSPRIVKEILVLGGDLAWVNAFREIKAKKLTVRLFLCPEGDDEDLGDDDEDDDFLDLGADESRDSDGDDSTTDHDEDDDDLEIEGSASGSDSGPSTDSDSDSSSSSSEESDLLLDDEERREALERELEPLMEMLLRSEIPRAVTEEDEYLASRIAEVAGGEDSDSSEL